MSVRRPFIGLIAGSFALLSIGCAEPSITGPDAASLKVAAAPVASSSGSSLLLCPAKHSSSVTKVIDARGGTLRLGGSTVEIPAGAVSSATQFTFSLPASPYMLIDVSAAGYEHFVFATPVQMTINYARCSNSYRPTAFAAWYVDRETGALLENMGGVDDKHGRKVTFSTSHLSGYAIAE